MGVLPPRQGAEAIDDVLSQFLVQVRNQPLRILPFVFLTQGGDKFTIMLWDFLRLEELGTGKTKVYTTDAKTATVDEDHDTVVIKMQEAAEAFTAEE